MEFTITSAFNHKEDIRELFAEYTDMLIAGDPVFEKYLEIQNYDAELAHLEKKYGEPEGRLYIAYAGCRAAGCIGFRKLDETSCEMKRLYVKPEFRGNHLGEILVDKILSEAREAGYRHMYLDTLPFLESAAFYPEKSPYEKIACCSVFGGSSFVLERIDDTKSLEANIKSILLDFSSPIFPYAENVLISEFAAKKGIGAERVLSALGYGKKHYAEIEKTLHLKSNGNLSKLIQSMISMELISRNAPINKQQNAKKVTYEIKDNLLRSYYTFIYKGKSALQMVGSDAFYDQYIAPTLTTFISYRFEEVCRSFFSIQAREGKFPGIRDIGTYYYDDPVYRRNGEFDVVLEYADGYDIFEAKYFLGTVNEDDIHREAEKIHKIEKLKARNIGFLAPNGFKNKIDGYLYYDGDDIYHAE